LFDGPGVLKHGKHAVVLGGSITGLLAARVLADHYAQVTVVERDRLLDWPSGRKGVPQGAHVHGIWPRGLDFIDQLLPGLKVALIAGGANVGDVAGCVNWHQFGGLKLRKPVGIAATMASRPFLECEMRRRVLGLRNVVVMEECAVAGLRTDLSGQRIDGVGLWIRGSSASCIDADVVVDATGRSGQAVRWLEALGYERPPESTVRIDLSYATRSCVRQPGQSTIGHIVFPTPPAGRRGGVAFAVEGNRWLVTLIGFMGEQPPTDMAGYVEYARSLPFAAIHDIVGSSQEEQTTALFKFPGNLRRHYEQMPRLPEGLLVMGDALASFNPAYGQGMTVAAMQAQVLQDCLRTAYSDAGLAKRFFKSAAKMIDVPWAIATGEDLRYPQAEGHRPALLSPLNAYLSRVHQAATVDAAVCKAFFGVASLQCPPKSLLTPAMIWRTLRGSMGLGEHRRLQALNP
jgi:2-polyprenyl-6-methoxyphenol hydroxylase-like FAD-dependent oxidoreductase